MDSDILVHDTYCRIVIRHASFDAARMLVARWKREISLEYLTEEKFVPLSTTDEYRTSAKAHGIITRGGTTAIGGNHMTNQSTIDKEVKKKSRKKPEVKIYKISILVLKN